MAYEYKMLEPLDYGHPGTPDGRFLGLIEQLNALSKEGWEVCEMIPSMIRGRMIEAGKDERLNITTVAMCVLLRRKVE